MVGSRNNEQSAARGAARGAWLGVQEGKGEAAAALPACSPRAWSVSRVGHVCRHVCAASCWHWSSHHTQQACTHACTTRFPAQGCMVHVLLFGGGRGEQHPELLISPLSTPMGAALPQPRSWMPTR